MKKSKILMLFLIIGLIISLFAGCIPTIPSSPSEIIDAENYNKNNDIVLGIPYYSAEGINNGCLCAAGAMIFGYYGFNVSPQELADYGLLMFPETTLNDEFGLFTELKRYAISNLNLKAKYGFLSIKKIKNEIDKGVPIIVLQYSNFPRIIPNLHYRVIHGYNDTEQKFVVSCAQGAYYDLSYSDFLHLNLIENVDKCPSMIIESNNLDVEADVDPKNGTPPHEVHCVGFASGGPMPYTYQWEFGDGNWSEKGMDVEHKNVFHTYLKSGKYTPILHVEDSSGNMGKCTAGVVTVEKKIPFIDGSVFANKQWIIDTDESPGSNLYSDSIENIWLDELGQLHFRMTRDKETKRWKCVEIYSDQQGWGYGKYEFEIEVVSDGKIDENVVIGLFAYDNSITAHKSNNELDIEFSRWGNPNADNGNFVVWYDTTEGDEKRNLCTFSLQLVGNSSIHSFEWANDNIIFDSSEITFCPLYPESFTYLEGDNAVGQSGDGYGYIPIPNKERVYMNLWLHNGKPYNEDKMEKVELVIKDFKFTPTLCGPVHNLTKNTYYNTIQAALDDADSGDTIEVSDGTYDESIVFPYNEKIILQSVNGPSSTIIRGNDDSNTVYLYSSLEGTTLEGFTITHESGNTGRGIRLIHNSYLIINNSNISDNFITDFVGSHTGGGISATESCELTINGSTISGNSASSGGGIGGYMANITINGSTISGNSATYVGGGIYKCYGTLTITESTISNNGLSDPISSGGGIFTGGGTLTITESTISGNTANNYGGGIETRDYTTFITGSIFSDNSAGYSGGGICLNLTSGTITIGGSNENDINNFNEFTDNYKTGNTPSPDQHICHYSRDCHMDFPYNNYYPDIQPPDAPVLYNLFYNPSSGASYDLTWSDESSSGAAGYEIEESEYSDFSSICGGMSTIDTSCTFGHDVTENTYYYYHVRSMSSEGVYSEEWSNTVEVIVMGIPKASITVVTRDHNGSLISGGISYILYDDSNPWNAICNSGSSSSNSYTFDDLEVSTYNIESYKYNDYTLQGFYGTKIDISLLEGQNKNVTIYTSAISVCTKDSNGNLISGDGLSYCLYLEDGSGAWHKIREVPAPSNNYTFTKIPSGTYNIEAYTNIIHRGTIIDVYVAPQESILREIVAMN